MEEVAEVFWLLFLAVLFFAAMHAIFVGPEG